jgi:hypothetical protein
MNTTLILPNKIKKTQPKPTKSQLIEALVVKAKEKFNKQKEEANIKQEKIIEEIKEKAIIAIPKRLNELEVEVNYRGDVSIRFVMNDSLFNKLGEKYQKADSIGYFDKNETKNKIKESLKSPNPLLDNPDLSIALENLLESIFNSKEHLVIKV